MTTHLQDAVDRARAAVEFDRASHFDAAIFYYRSAAEALQRAHEEGHPLTAEWQTKLRSYLDRMQLLMQTRDEGMFTNDKSDQAKKSGPASRAKFLLSQALDEDEEGNKEAAIEFYSDAVQLCIDAIKACDNDVATKEEMEKLAREALNRAETLKGLSAISKPTAQEKPKQPSYLTGRIVPPLGFGNIRPELPKPAPVDQKALTNKIHPAKLLEVSGSGRYTPEEIAVLKHGSRINGRDYVPFMDVDLRERFAFPMPYVDKDGQLELALKQKQVFSRWARIDELSTDPKIIDGQVECFSIRQTVVSDCSFVASLAVGALYEKRFPGKRIITGILYPQNSKGQPVFNPCGKYMVKLHINGVSRKIIVDDFLPVNGYGQLLCSYSSNKNEFWVSILEKAYMKVMGGYDFPGSNSSIDLSALTGWIPERMSISDMEDQKSFYQKLQNHFHRGDVLVTLATGDLPQAQADRAGLVPTHAYAVLDVREVLGTKLLMLKNPWAQLRWKGNFSELDRVHWTPEMKAALKFDPHSAKMFDNGVFWIDYASILKFFDVFYLSWNPKLFSHTYCIHRTWNAGSGPAKDLYSIGSNPQFRLEVNEASGSVWVLLTRHITEIEDFKNNKEYITLLVYKTGGQRVYYPYDPKPYIDGIRINSPHYLCKIDLKDAACKTFTLVVSQYEKSNTIHYTLRAYAASPFSLGPIGNPFKYKQEDRSGQWKGITAGGCANHAETYKNNPTYQISLDGPGSNDVLVELRGPKQYSVGFDVICVVANNKESPGYFSRKSSGAFRSGYVVLQLSQVPSGTYNIIPATYYPGQEGPFFLTVSSSCPVKMARL